jgi:2,4-dienoyl-CoA reductase-like NADH-dependent reductase (Old Yellow Enzyme family)/thioredoxin reductase
MTKVIKGAYRYCPERYIGKERAVKAFVSGWMDHIPTPKPFLRGKHFLTDFVETSKEVVMAKLKYSKLFEPGVIGRMQVKNRIVLPPCTTNFAGPTGEVTDRLISYYAERARGGAGLLIIENTQVKYPEGKNVSCQLRLDNDKYIPGCQELADAIHLYGAKVFQQIHHAGRQVHNTEGVQPVAPSAIPCGFLQIPVRELTTAEIWDLVERFSETALRVKKSGMDGVEFHGAHGYLLGEFMSPHTNQRIDEWGGTFERRMKFLTEIVKRTRQKVGPDFPLCLRYSADEFVPGGLTLDDGKQIAKLAESLGINVLHVSSGIYESIPMLLETMRFKEGWRVYLAEEVRKVVKVPVITVGQIKTPAFAEKVLQDGKADFVALGRPLIADPYWPNKAREGKDEEIRKCISCNSCIGGHVFNDLYMRCAVNPVVGRERLEGWVELKPATKKKKVTIVGGGPAGMEAARVAALRGHDVTLYEKERELGGQVTVAALAPGRDKLNYILEYCVPQLKAVGAKVEIGKTVDEKLIRAVKPDVLIVATGADPLIPDTPCSWGKSVLIYWDVLTGKSSVIGEKVVVAGGGVGGCEVALHIAQQGKKVTIVEMLDELALDEEPITRFDLLTNQLPEAGVQSLTGRTITEISDKGVTVLDHHGRKTVIEADSVVIALGTKSVETLAEKAKDIVPEVYFIGDSKKPRKVLDAIYEGAAIARLI